MLKEKLDNHEAIAIIGMAGIFPRSPDIKAFWQNILNTVDSISDPLPEWEAARYLDSGRINTSFGGYLKDLYRFDPQKYGVMPHSIDGGEPDQYLALRVACEALEDAGYLGDGYDHKDTGIVLGHSTYLHRGQGNLIQHHIVLDQTLEFLRAVIPSIDDDKASQIREIFAGKLPQSNADNAPGLVPNVMTGRIANRLNLRGPNYIVDAACSSSLIAVSAAVDELYRGRSRLMLAGGVNASLPAEASIIFTQLGALSKNGKIQPFGINADGTLLGEGLGVVVLKRLSEAIEDSNKIYAVIKGIGIASDGKALGLLAPNVEGEVLAIERAYASSGIDPATVELLEAHGTGIPLGDKTEISALRKIFGERKTDQGSVALGSIKSMIGHCIPAAGIAGFIKSALALYHKILPPTICDTINPDLELEKTPFYINRKARPWIAQPGTPRRAGINAFGFGGINAHVILEESPALAQPPQTFTPWPFELCVFSATSLENLTDKLRRWAALVAGAENGRLCDIAAGLARQKPSGPHRLALVVKDLADLAQKIDQALKRLEKDSGESWATRSGLVYSRRPLEGKIAFMFPGEGSQYLGMFADLALHFDDARTWFEFWRGLYDEPAGESRTDIVFAPESELTDSRLAELEKRLHDMDVGSEAVFIASQAMRAILKTLGVQPDVMVGHSTGESSALAASGAMDYNDFDQLAYFIKELNQVYQGVLGEGNIPTGVLMSVGALPRSTVEEHITALNNGIVVAMDNCTNQLVLFGEPASIDKLEKSLIDAGGICMPLPFDRGYHTPQFSTMSKAFLDYYERIGLTKPRVPLYSCSTADKFPDDEDAVRKLAAGQWSTRVRFRETITQMHRDGVRYFVEVGPSGNLSAFVNDIFSGEEYLAIATNLRPKNGVGQLLTALAHLYVNDRQPMLEKLFQHRSVNILDLEEGLKGSRPKGMALDNTMPVVHLNDADRAGLRAMMPLREQADNAARSKSSEPVPPIQAAPPLSESKASDDDRVMSEYFSLMRGFLEQQRRVWESVGMPVETEPENARPWERHTPFLIAIDELDDRRLTASCRLNVYEDNFLRDHVLSGPVSDDDPDLLGLSCVPLMVSLEIMAEACAVLSGSTVVTVIENIEALAWIALDDGELTFTVRAEAIDGANDKYRADLISDGRVAARAEFRFGEDWRTTPLPALGEQRPFRWDGRELYRIGMFHGPIFQSIDRVYGWSDQGIDAGLSNVSLDGFFDDNAATNLVLNPVLLDAMGQLSAYWIAQQVGTDFNCFPSTIERIELYRPCPQNMTGLTLRARQQPIDPNETNIGAPRAWHFECLDSQGQPLLRATNLVNVYFAVPHAFYEVRRDPLNGWLGQPQKATGRQNVILWRLPHFSDEFCTQSGGIFLRILAHAVLSHEEREQWRELKGKLGRRLKWLFGRICIKEAVRYWIYQQTETLLYPSDIVVLHDQLGAPYVDGWWNEEVFQAPEVSLSHNGRLSIAAVAAPHDPVGIDTEDIGRFKSTDLIEGSLAACERTLLRGLAGHDLSDKVLRMWCAKEAAAKCLRTGLKGTPEKFEVSFVGDDWKRARVQHDDFLIEVELECEKNSIIALASAPST